jgi:non-specific serine/threonine protein kinase
VCEEGLAMLGPGTGEQWIRTYLLAVSGFALVHMSGREDDCDRVLRQAVYGKQELGDVIGMAYSLDVLGWLAAKTGAPERTAWLLGAAEPMWERGGSVRFSGTAIMEEYHLLAERSATTALGPEAYDAAYAAGYAYVRDRLAAGTEFGALRLEIP